jgi:hypothetical protein
MVRMVSTTGRLGFVPEEKVEEAKADGLRVIGVDEMKDMRQQIFMEHAIFKEQRKPAPSRHKRKSIIRSGRTR